MNNKLLVFDSHPVQYRVPLWQAIEKLIPGCLHVVYASDISVRGYTDNEFGETFAWDVPMLSGYSYSILNSEKGESIGGWGSLTGKGVKEIIEKLKPDVVLLTSLKYRYDLAVYLNASRKFIPVWLRCETQDYATDRSNLKAILRSIVYKVVYLNLKRIFYIGELNKDHYIKHSVDLSILRPARYCTVDAFINMSLVEKQALRVSSRNAALIPQSAFVIGFSGKFIEKKNPDILFQMLEYLPAELLAVTCLYFMGSGKLDMELKSLAATAKKKYNVMSFFAGFINQSGLAPNYLAMDIMILPSLRMGETWGLVANEAMQAGCGVIVSDAVGCGADFFSWEKFRIFKNGHPKELANCVIDLSRYERDYDWARQKLISYSVQATADIISDEFKQFVK